MITLGSLAAALEQHQYLAYGILFLGAYFETFVGTAFFVYGEIFFLSGAIVAGAGFLNIWLVSLACITGGILGDSSSYLVGRRYGTHVTKLLFKKDRKYLSHKHYEHGRRAFHKRGKNIVLFARFMGPIGWITPFVAGTLRMPYRDFIIRNAPSVTAGIGMFMIVGYFAGFAYKQFLPFIEWIVLSIVCIALLVLWVMLWRKKKAKTTPALVKKSKQKKSKK